tara:strand:- start:259 stop:525 length:267 start_codon:yes stop_codon:yes gene_type:complete
MVKREDVILYLDKYKEQERVWDYPRDISQAGLADEFNCVRSYVCKIIYDLEAEGFIKTLNKHVIGTKRKRNIYLLTSKGREYAKQLRE